MRIVGYAATAVAAGVVVMVIVTGATSTRDIKRYLRMRRM